MVEQPCPCKKTSWLSLVAETAGVEGATIARVNVAGRSTFEGVSTVYVQVIDSHSNVVGAARRAITAADLQQGFSVDVGCDLLIALGATVVAWMERGLPERSARDQMVPAHATRRHFEPCVQLLIQDGKRRGPRSTKPSDDVQHQAA
jgi:hypothetical protein